MSGKEPRLSGNSHPNISPYDQYPTGNGRIFIGAGNNRQFRLLCEELGRPGLADEPRFRDNADRVAHRAELNAILLELLAREEAEALAKRLSSKGTPAGAVLSVGQVMEHAHTAVRQMTVSLDGYRGTGLALKFARTPGAVRLKPPLFGASTRAVLAEAGYDAAEVEALVEQGIALEERSKGPA